MSAPPPPPPRHNSRISTTKSTTASSSTIAGGDVGKKTWRDSLKDKGKVWGGKAYEKSWKLSDAVGVRVNEYAGKMGSERFYPTQNDFPEEMEKAARILRAFTVDGIPTTVTTAAAPGSGTSTPSTSAYKQPKGKQQKVLRKIPPEVIAEAKGLAIFTSMRSGIAPFGGAGGAGLVVARLPDGSWSAPSSTSPNNLSTGFLLGVDIYDAVLVIRTEKALESFFTHKATLGTDFAVVAGPFGIGATAEAGLERAPVFSYIRSRGFYAGVSIMGQVFIGRHRTIRLRKIASLTIIALLLLCERTERFEENGAMYHWPGIKGADILTGKVPVPREAASLMEALKDAETGKAQKMKGDGLDLVVPEGASEIVLEDGEVLKLPPTPTQVEDTYGDGDPEAEKVHYEHHASQLSEGLAKAHIQESPSIHAYTAATPPPLPSRARNVVSPGAGVGVGLADHKDSGLGRDVVAGGETTMDPAEAKEWQQHLEQEERDRAAAAAVDQSHDSGLEARQSIDTTRPSAEATRPATRLSRTTTHEEDVFHDADVDGEQPTLPPAVPTTTTAPAALATAEQDEHERLDLK
ncbi:hypothetical protein QFC22_006041 [Naganishia vaughanmartiniae]|uniref:Uncharacterized protein n=1 Tax=Naganishia vaughanmartiniae TaxID=1424756 RepID=A0ACC2WQ78_9TREE|nr:hypothetical protein QFC22_006041 [Naganishia vaughanmartiniae]